MERRNFSAQFKQQIVRECQETGNVSLVCRKHDLNAMLQRQVNCLHRTYYRSLNTSLLTTDRPNNSHRLDLRR